MWRAFPLASFALFLAVAGLGFGQDSLPADAGVVIRSTTSLVQVRVVAEDTKGNPVADLQRGNFAIEDDRKTQPITLFVLNRSAATNSSSPSSSNPDLAEPVGMAPAYSLIVLDWINSEYTDRFRAQEQVIRLLKHFQPSQRVAVFLLGKQSRLLHDFTSDMGELIQAIEGAGLDPADMDGAVPGRFDAQFGSRSRPRPSVEEQIFFLNNKINDTFHAFNGIADNLARVPGRKSLIWLSTAFPMTINGGVIPGAKPAEIVYLQDLEKLLARLNRADVAVYPVDASGLAVNAHSYRGTMLELATRTGGTVFADRNDLDEGVRLALEDMTISYTLGFNVPPGAALGLHELRVRVNRPGLRLRYRESYQLVNR